MNYSGYTPYELDSRLNSHTSDLNFALNQSYWRDAVKDKYSNKQKDLEMKAQDTCRVLKELDVLVNSFADGAIEENCVTSAASRQTMNAILAHAKGLIL